MPTIAIQFEASEELLDDLLVAFQEDEGITLKSAGFTANVELSAVINVTDEMEAAAGQGEVIGANSDGSPRHAYGDRIWY